MTRIPGSTNRIPRSGERYPSAVDTYRKLEPGTPEFEAAKVDIEKEFGNCDVSEGYGEHMEIGSTWKVTRGAESKESVVLESITSRWETADQISQRAGVTRETALRWAARFVERGIVSLKKRGGEKNRYRLKEEEVENSDYRKGFCDGVKAFASAPEEIETYCEPVEDWQVHDAVEGRR